MADHVYLRTTGAREVEAKLARLGLKLSDIDFTQIANEGMRLAVRFAAVMSRNAPPIWG